LQVTIPNEWERIAPVNIGFTAGMETTKVAHQWLQKGNEMDKILVVSDHSRDTYRDTTYIATHNETGEQMELKLQTPIVTTNYPVKDFGEAVELGLELDYDFNFLVMAQAGPRKNLPNTLRWFVEEFHDEEVGLVVKANIAKNCLMDREKLHNDLKGLLGAYPERKCKVYLLHGDMADREIHCLFEHPQIQAFVTLTHGEGFGLPIFEAAYSGTPLVATGWSGQLDFLVNKSTNTEEYYQVDFDLQPIPDEVAWEGVIIKDSMWAYPREQSAKKQMRECYIDLTGPDAATRFESAKAHARYLAETFSEESQNGLMVAEICETLGISTEGTESEVMEID